MIVGRPSAQLHPEAEWPPAYHPTALDATVLHVTTGLASNAKVGLGRCEMQIQYIRGGSVEPTCSRFCGGKPAI
eukprot:2080146-Amphidinium_carterae.1